MAALNNGVVPTTVEEHRGDELRRAERYAAEMLQQGRSFASGKYELAK